MSQPNVEDAGGCVKLESVRAQISQRRQGKTRKPIILLLNCGDSCLAHEISHNAWRLSSHPRVACCYKARGISCDGVTLT